MKFWLTKSFRVLQRAWYQRLTDAGFDDAEELVDGELRLRQNAHHSVAYEHQDRRAAREEYYRMLRAFAAAEAFESEVDRVIMTMAAEGARRRDIAERLNTMGIRRPPRFLSDQRRCRESIRLTIRKYEQRWGLRDEEREAG